VSAVTVRPAQPADATQLYAAWQALRRHYAATDARIIPAPVSQAEFAEDLARRLARPNSAVFVATATSGAIIGFITGSIDENQLDRLPELHATVGYLFVDPAARRHGAGRQLFASLAAWALTRDGVSHFEMPVLAVDSEAGHFWRALGFTPFIERLWAPLSAADGRA
jgi:GNAT superfamily N-acetyltransferase